MANKRLTNKQVLGYLKEGKTVSDIVKLTGRKYNTVNAHRKRLIRIGLWERQNSGTQFQMSLDGLTDWLIERLKLSKQVEDTEAENYQLRNRIKCLENEVHNLREDMQVKVLRDNQYKILKQQGILPEIKT